MTMQLEFTLESLEELNYERYRHPLPLVQPRMEALWLKSQGLPHGQIAQLVNITRRTHSATPSHCKLRAGWSTSHNLRKKSSVFITTWAPLGSFFLREKEF